jgi:hypothetical protein
VEGHPSNIYIIDLYAAGPQDAQALMIQLQPVLEDSSITKVLHDARMVRRGGPWQQLAARQLRLPSGSGMTVYFLVIVTSAQLRSRCSFWLALKANQVGLQTVHHVLHAASESGC